MIEKKNWNGLGAGGRIGAVDLARALALIGMVIAHLYTPYGLLREITLGFPSALFAMLSGISLAIMAESAEKRGTAVRIFHHQMTLRGLILILIGFAINPFSGEIKVVLFSIGIAYIVLPYFSHYSLKALSALLLLLALLSIATYVMVSMGYLPYTNLIGSYPIFTWFTYTLAGMIFYRIFLQQAVERPRLGLLTLVLVVSLAVSIAGIKLRTWHSSGTPYWVLKTVDFQPHSGGVGDLVTSLAGSAVVISACIMVYRLRILAILAYPLAAMGAMSLSIYIAHVISAGKITLASSALRFEQEMWMTLVFSLVLATIIKYFFGKGPAEYLLAQSVKKLTQ